jgi:hypothetical protein
MVSCSVALRMAIECGRGTSGSLGVRSALSLVIVLVIVVVGMLMVIAGIVSFMVIVPC